MAGRSLRLGDDHRLIRGGASGCPRAPQSHEIERGITEIGHFFVPLFFVAVGASVDLEKPLLNPLDPATRHSLLIGVALIITSGVAGKLAAGYAPFWFHGNKLLIGVGMVPRGEVGLIFAQAGLSSGVFGAGLFGAVTMMVIVTTLAAHPRCWASPCSVLPALQSRHRSRIERNR